MNVLLIKGSLYHWNQNSNINHLFHLNFINRKQCYIWKYFCSVSPLVPLSVKLFLLFGLTYLLGGSLRIRQTQSAETATGFQTKLGQNFYTHNFAKEIVSQWTPQGQNYFSSNLKNTLQGQVGLVTVCSEDRLR